MLLEERLKTILNNHNSNTTISYSFNSNRWTSNREEIWTLLNLKLETWYLQMTKEWANRGVEHHAKAFLVQTTIIRAQDIKWLIAKTFRKAWWHLLLQTKTVSHRMTSVLNQGNNHDKTTSSLQTLLKKKRQTNSSKIMNKSFEKKSKAQALVEFRTVMSGKTTT